jgi:hypothetical protein
MSKLFYVQGIRKPVSQVVANFVNAYDRDEAVKLFREKYERDGHTLTVVRPYAVPRPKDKSEVLDWGFHVPVVDQEDNELATRITKAANDGSYNPNRPPR